MNVALAKESLHHRNLVGRKALLPDAAYLRLTSRQWEDTVLGRASESLTNSF
jgi:hypothetical protein